MTATEPIRAYTDGACSGNPGPGGWAWIVPDGPFASGPAAHTTNQRMEITAAFEAVRSNPGPVEVVSDSTYVVNCFRDRWWEGWLARGWKNSQRKPVANRDLWEPFIDLVVERGDVTFRWVKGHAGDRWNDMADRLAVEAGSLQTGRTGDSTPETVGAPDKIGGSSSHSGGRGSGGRGSGGRDSGGRDSGGRDSGGPGGGATARPYVGHAIGVFGHRPLELGGYDHHETEDRVRARFVEILSAKQQLDQDLVVISGLRLGAEQLGAEAARHANIPYVAVLPFPKPDAVWPQPARRRFAELVSSARDTLTLEKTAPSDKRRVGAALARRDGWLARHLDEAIVVWDGQDPRLGKLVRSLETHLGEDVWLVDPR